MSHQSGITASADLLEKMADAKQSEHIRMLKIIIDNEQLVCVDVAQVSADWEHDYTRLIPACCDDKNACYLLFRLDSKTENGAFEWWLFSYVPDAAHPRQKMTNASTRATLRREFGLSFIKDDFFASNKLELTLEAHHAALKSRDAPPALTFAEQELAEIKQDIAGANAGIDHKHATMKSIAFPLTDEAEQAVSAFRDGVLAYVQFGVDETSESVVLHRREEQPLNVDALRALIPEQAGRYHLYRFMHQVGEQDCASDVLIYSIPGYRAQMKERMLSASGKSAFISFCEANAVAFARKLEIDSPTELTEESLVLELHPELATQVEKKTFNKPKGPAGRRPGARTTAAPADAQS